MIEWEGVERVVEGCRQRQGEGREGKVVQRKAAEGEMKEGRLELQGKGGEKEEKKKDSMCEGRDGRAGTKGRKRREGKH